LTVWEIVGDRELLLNGTILQYFGFDKMHGLQDIKTFNLYLKNKLYKNEKKTFL